MKLSLFRPGQRDAMEVRQGLSCRLPKLEYPLSPIPRLAVLGLTVRQESGIHSYPEWTSQQLNSLRPLALAGWLRDLEQVVHLRQSGRLILAELSYPLLVFSTPEQGPLTEECHARLWAWFRVPIYEQIRTEDGRLIAVECENRNGFHTLETETSVRSQEQCDCGSGATRWVPWAKGMVAAAGD